MRSCLASRRSVSGWGLVTHGARALQPNGFRFRFIPRKVPGLSANPLGFRGGGGAAVQEERAINRCQPHRIPWLTETFRREIVKSRFTILGGKKAIYRGGGPRAQGLVRAGVVPTTPRSLERVRREMSHLLVVLCRPGNFCSFSL